MTVFYPLQRSIAPRRRTAQWVGKPRIRLAEQLDKKLAELGYECEIECSDIRPATGSWRTDVRLDVYRVEGALKIKGASTNGLMVAKNLCSWDTITDMLRHGFDVDLNGFWVELSARKSRTHPALKRFAAEHPTQPEGSAK